MFLMGAPVSAMVWNRLVPLTTMMRVGLASISELLRDPGALQLLCDLDR
jgi:hypothetical protein